MAQKIDLTPPETEIIQDVSDATMFTLRFTSESGFPSGIEGYELSGGIYDKRSTPNDEGQLLEAFTFAPVDGSEHTEYTALLTDEQNVGIGVGKFWWRIDIEDETGNVHRLAHGRYELRG